MSTDSRRNEPVLSSLHQVSSLAYVYVGLFSYLAESDPGPSQTQSQDSSVASLNVKKQHKFAETDRNLGVSSGSLIVDSMNVKKKEIVETGPGPFETQNQVTLVASANV